MGCCLSSENGYSASATKKQSRSPVKKQSRAPPPSSMEEETVKEVLSETPTPKPHIHLNPPKCQPQKLPAFDGAPDLVELSRQLAERAAVKGANASPQRRLDELKPKQKQKQAEEISEEVSDICSLSESVSISTATNLTDDSGVVHHHHQGHRGPHRSPAKTSRPRSFSGEMAARRDQTAQSQLRRPEQSPRRRNAGPVRPSLAGDPNRPRSAPRRRERDPGESSARRSRSPAVTRVENPGQDGPRSRVGRSPSARRTNPSPGRVRSDPNERRVGRALDGDDNRVEGGERLGPGTSTTKQADGNGDESADLDNPLVSLECFIFL